MPAWHYSFEIQGCPDSTKSEISTAAKLQQSSLVFISQASSNLSLFTMDYVYILVVILLVLSLSPILQSSLILLSDHSAAWSITFIRVIYNRGSSWSTALVRVIPSHWSSWSTTFIEDTSSDLARRRKTHLMAWKSTRIVLVQFPLLRSKEFLRRTSNSSRTVQFAWWISTKEIDAESLHIASTCSTTAVWNLGWKKWKGAPNVALYVVSNPTILSVSVMGWLLLK